MPCLRRHGLALALISGDRAPAVRRLADAVGMKAEECYAGRSPEAKAKLLAAMPQPSLYVGDGLNDVVGLATASVGVAPLGANSTVQEGASVALPDAPPVDLPPDSEATQKFADCSRR